MICCFSNNGKVQWPAFSKYVACSVIIFNPFTLGNVAENCFLKLIKLFSGHCLATKSLNAVCELRTSQRLLFQMQSISFQHLIMLRKQNFKLVLGLKVTQQSWHLFFASSPPIDRKCFGEACRIIGLDRRTCKWVVEQDFKGNGFIVKH